MSITPSAYSPSTAPTSASTPSLSSTSLGTDTFLKLLVAQLSNQDPSQPMDSSSFLTQLAQFNSVEQMNNVNTTLTTILSANQLTQAASMIGQTVQYSASNAQGQTVTQQGVVQSVAVNGGAVQVMIGQQPVGIQAITAIMPTPATSPATTSPAAASSATPSGR